ncbi:MAG: DNA-directed RNA polymerase subunit alpha [Candidatus Pacebacteria bacterium]|nr:DNA-directed RNA polymerase subunit alpha [Candidatus Paceibacterota bacterium]
MISLPSSPKIKDEKENNAVFEIDSLYPGYGITIGNSLRRVLLSSLGGAAITKIRIEGVNHEFSTIPGVMEDVITIILNLRELRFKLHGDEQQIMKLSIKGEKEIKASSFKIPTQVEIVNKDAYIATITDKKASLDMEVEIEKGVGYSMAQERKEAKLGVGQIMVDSVFTPIKTVKFHVENMRVGKRTDFDRLFLEVETDGTITPKEAYTQAVNILKDHFSAISFTEEKEKKEKAEVKEEKEAKTEKKEAKTTKKAKADKKETKKEEVKIEDLKLSKRTERILIENKIKKEKDLLKKTESDILSLKGMGEKGLEEIKAKSKLKK